MTSTHEGTNDHDGLIEGLDADHKARRILQAQNWPILDPPLLLAQSTRQARWQTEQLIVPTLAVGCLAALAIILMVSGANRERPPTLMQPVDSGQILCLGSESDRRLIGVEPYSGTQIDLGPTSLGRKDGFVPTGRDAWMQISPDGEAIALSELTAREDPLGFRLTVRSTQPSAEPVLVASPMMDRRPTSFVWSPTGDEILYIAELAEVYPAVGARGSWVPSVFDLHQVTLDRASDGTIANVRDTIIWQRTAHALESAWNVGVVGWDHEQRRAAVVIQHGGSIVPPKMTIVDLTSGESAADIPLGSVYTRDVASPDGRWVAHAECPKPQQNCQAASGSVWLIELSTGRVVEIPTVEAAGKPSQFVWSRDSKLLAWREWLASPGSDPASLVRLANVDRDGAPSTRVIAYGVDLSPVTYSPAADMLLVAEAEESNIPPMLYRAYSVDERSSGEPREVVGWNKTCWGWVLDS